MPRIAYKEHNFRAASLALIEQAQTVLDEYAEQGYTLTLRQLYYQMVARLYLENTTRAYKRLGQLLVDARLAGVVDWNAIIDRTRALEGNPHWESPTEVLDEAFDAYQIDKWANQDYRVEVWIEKDALVGVIEQTCQDLDIDYFSCRGYPSISEVWKAARRLRRYTIHGQTPVVLHFSDHDPSGIDMTRDLDERLALFAGFPIEVHRMALLRRQVDHFGLPPNPAKLSDSRAGDYVHRHMADPPGSSTPWSRQ